MSKTIVEKLNLTKYKKIAVLHMPKEQDYLQELSGYDTELKEGKYDLIFAFVFDMEELKRVVNRIIENNLLDKNGYIFLAYPKKGNKKYDTFIHRDSLLEGLGTDSEGYVGASTIKFARMVGLDEVFTIVGLKDDAKNKNKPSTKPSQCVDDYIELIPSIEQDLKGTPELLTFYQSLTPGYRKDWARFVYSAKQEKTREKRREEMKAIMTEGYKSRDLYRAAQKK
ncbi:YdeI/OmpD-associated family protein [Bacillus timonensis]|nr:YdeI/OmpD-associated family protein [Bacillus timonensis]